ncbi:MAG: hypothetical protein COA90_02210 [Gammaproteobacteria bacterium]|nr:MAG: hypothetical protein COA90_02210 [Gammaproteobacteria bacterium]
MQRTAIVVDDSRVARLTLKKLLEAADFSVVEFSSGEEVLNYLATTSELPDIIFMDVIMDGMSGLDTTKKIKDNILLKNIPVVMCTGNDTEEDRIQALAAGAIAALSKPPVANTLTDILATVKHEDSVPVVEPVDEEKLLKTVLASLADDFEPRIKEDTRDIAEVISRQIVETEIETAVTVMLKSSMMDVTEKLNADMEIMIQKVALQACKATIEETLLDAVTQAVQVVVDEAQIPNQIEGLVAEKGEVWLTEQEEELGTQLTAQLEYLIPAKVNQHLESALSTTLTPLVTELVTSLNDPVAEQEKIEVAIHTVLHKYSSTVLEPLISATVTNKLAEDQGVDNQLASLTEQISLLKNGVIGLGIAVVALTLFVLF